MEGKWRCDGWHHNLAPFEWRNYNCGSTGRLFLNEFDDIKQIGEPV